MKYVAGPDFPTGGIIFGKRGIKEAYLTGRGKLHVRGKFNIETLKGGKEQIIFTEIPYAVNKADLVAKIAGLVRDKIVEGVADVRDESDRDGMRINYPQPPARPGADCRNPQTQRFCLLRPDRLADQTRQVRTPPA